MKTYSGAPELVPAAPCGGCGPAQDRINLLKKVVSGLVWGHNSVADMYDQLATEQVGDEAQALRDAAARHRRLAKEAEVIVVPDNLEIPT